MTSNYIDRLALIIALQLLIDDIYVATMRNCDNNSLSDSPRFHNSMSNMSTNTVSKAGLARIKWINSVASPLFQPKQQFGEGAKGA